MVNVVSDEIIANLHVVGHLFTTGLPSIVVCKKHGTLIVLQHLHCCTHQNPLTCRNDYTHNTRDIASFTSTSSASVELWVLVFCLFDRDMMDLHPKVIVTPV